MQQQIPQQSPFISCCLLKSPKKNGEKIVKAATYSVAVITPAKRQKLLRAAILVNDPVKKAIALVTEVIVIDGPAWVNPILNLSFAERCMGV